MHILFLGGTRFIGAAAVRALVGAGHDVTVFHRGSTENPLPPVRHVHGDRAALAEHRHALVHPRPDVVVDMRSLGEADTRAVQDTFRGVARRHVLISSIDVYQAYDALRRRDTAPPPGVIDEDAPLRRHLFPYRNRFAPGEPMYDYDKIPAEQKALADEELPATVLRLPMVWGPDDYQHRLYDYVARMSAGRPVVLLQREAANVRFARAFVDDVGAAIALAATDERASGRVYNVVDEPVLTEEQWVQGLGHALGWSGEIVKVDELPPHLKEDEDLDVSVSLAATARRIRDELGWAPHAPKDEALRRTAAWELGNPPATLSPRDDAAEDAAARSR